MKKSLKYILGSVGLLATAYLLGPKPKKPVFNPKKVIVPEINHIEAFVTQMEQKHRVRAGNEAEIVWADSSKKKTPYSIVYLHGFSASKNEGNPIHLQLAKKLKANLYLARLADHGLDTIAPMQFLTGERLWKSSKQAYAIAQTLGEKVIVMGTSTGGSLALMLAATYPEIQSTILLSPNIRIYDKNAWLLNQPWGLQLARKIIGGDERIVEDEGPEKHQFWYMNYRVEAIVELEAFLQAAMVESTFKKIKQPTLMLYYYKNETEQDMTVSVEAMLNMFDQLKTPQELKRKVALPESGAHVLGSYLVSKDLPGVEKAINDFLPQLLK